MRWQAFTRARVHMFTHAHVQSCTRAGVHTVLLAGLLLLWPVVSQAQCPGVTTPQAAFAQEQLTIDTTAKALTPGIYQPPGSTPSMAIVTVEGGDIRYDLIQAPTSSVGHYLTATPPLTFAICGRPSIQTFRAIRATGTNATLTVTYFKVAQ